MDTRHNNTTFPYSYRCHSPRVSFSANLIKFFTYMQNRIMHDDRLEKKLLRVLRPVGLDSA